MNKKTIVSIVAIVAAFSAAVCACLLALAGIFAFQNRYALGLSSPPTLADQTAPDFELTSLNGETIRLSQLRGQPVVLVFNTTWCPDCRTEAPMLQALHGQYSPGLVVLSVDLQEPADVVQPFADEFGWTFDVLLDIDGKASSAYYVYAIPTWLFIDAEGVVRGKRLDTPTETEMNDFLLKIGITPVTH